jgi:fibronectin-binding autotransporter adhesin
MTKFYVCLLAASLFFVNVLTASAQSPLFWDVNSTNAGSSDDGVPTGTWNSTNTNWTTDGLGGAATPGIWDSTNTPVAEFSAAGGAAGSSYFVHVADAESANGLTFDDVLVTIDSTGGTLTLNGATPIVSIPTAGNQATITAPLAGTGGLSLTGGALSTLVLNSTSGANTYSGATSVGAGTVLKLGSAGQIPDGSVLTVANGSSQTKFDMNGNNETVRSISSTSTGSAGTIAIGANTLTIVDQTGDSNTYTGLYTSSAGGKIVKNGDGTLILNNFPAGFTGGEFIVNSGTVGIGQNNVFGTNGNGSKLTINPNNLATGPTLKRTGATINLGNAFMDIGGNFTYDNNGTSDTQYNGNAGASTTTLKADNPVITVINGSRTGGVFIFAGDIVDDGNIRGFTKAGAGTMLLGSKTNAYRGATTIQEGFLRVRKQTNAGNIGTARIGDGTGAVNLSGGQLEFNGSVITAGDPRTFTVTNPINVTATNSSIGYFSATATLGATNTIDFIFSSNTITTPGGDLAFKNEGSCTDNGGAGTCTFRPTFSGSGFTVSIPVTISNHATVNTRATQLNSTNATGTQTWSGPISGTGSLRRVTAGGTTVLSGANSFTGGAIVDGGTLSASLASTATFGGGDVTVNAGNAAIGTGVADAIGNTKKLTLLGGGIAGADTGYIDLAAGISERVGTLVLGSTTQTNGLTYGSTSSSALVQNNEYFSGAGIISMGVPGDYNGDQVVDGGDYVQWRKSPGTYGGTPGGYNLWRANYGATGPGSGAGAGRLIGGGSVPEPGTISLVIFAIGSVAATSRRRSRR